MKKVNLFKLSLLLIASSLLFSSASPKQKTSQKNIGIQLYTLKDMCKANIDSTLQQVASIGFTEIEMYGYSDGKVLGKTPAEFKATVEGLNMKLISGHIGIDKNNYEEMIAMASELGLKYIVKPSMSKEKYNTLAALKETAEEFNFIGEKVKAAGMKFGYHNHAFEFDTVEGVVVMDYLLANTNPDLVTFEPDFYWYAKAGKNPIEYFQKYPGRFELFHIKDMAKMKNYLEEKKNISTVVGKGVINFQEIFAHAELAGMKHYFLEQERFENIAPIDAVTKGFKYMNKTKYMR